MTTISPTSDARRPRLDDLWDDHYADLKKLARSRLRLSGRGPLMDTTCLVHESYLKLLASAKSEIGEAQRAQFFAHASKVMRSVIVDMARQHLAERRGGGEVLRLDTQNLDQAIVEDDPLYVDEAVEALRLREPRLAQIVEMRFFGGLTELDIAQALNLSERTVRNDWNKARVLMKLLLE
ncbi:ECF-type sigma factor [Hydrocarboniphaga sp.]|uniref:ECF-type sigma factor n=1 Tax=Hydrocarboniphaga sp. TaxID=2033016 RepID=UPI003D0ED362